jgi:hypothetical protein
LRKKKKVERREDIEREQQSIKEQMIGFFEG